MIHTANPNVLRTQGFSCPLDFHQCKNSVPSVFSSLAIPVAPPMHGQLFVLLRFNRNDAENLNSTHLARFADRPGFNHKFNE